MKIHPNCQICQFYKYCKNPFMKYTGNGKLKILIIGEAPGKDEDENNIQFIGRCGQLFRKCLKEINLDMEKDFWKTNCVRCRPINNKTPDDKVLDLCLPQLKKDIEILKPKAILCVGGIALKNIIFRTFPNLPKKGITYYHGQIFESPKQKIKIMSIFHPSYLLRRHDKILIDQFKNDILKLIKEIENENTIKFC